MPAGRRIELVPLGDLRENPANPKRHELDGVAASIDRLGLIDLPVVDERTGLLVAGHGRASFLRGRQADGGPAPAEVVVRDDGEWLVPTVRGWASRDDDEATAAAIALNAWVSKGGWDPDGLTAILRRLADTDAGLAGVGYEDSDLADLLRTREEYGAGGAARGETSIDELAENYRNKQVRTMVLDYPLAEFKRVQELSAEARKRWQVPGNAELLMALLRRYDKEHPTDG